MTAAALRFDGRFEDRWRSDRERGGGIITASTGTMLRSALCLLLAFIPVTKQEGGNDHADDLIPVRVALRNEHQISLDVYWFDVVDELDVAIFMTTILGSNDSVVVDTFVGERYGVARTHPAFSTRRASDITERFVVRAPLLPTHSRAIEDDALCSFGAPPRGVPPPRSILADTLPRLRDRQMLSDESFHATRSIKWTFRREAGALEVRF